MVANIILILSTIKKIKVNMLFPNFQHILWINLILLNIIYISNQKQEINLIVKGPGTINFVSKSFYKEPSEYIINGSSTECIDRTYNFSNEINNVTIKFDSPIETCQNMFKDITNIIEIDLSKFDFSNITNMGYMFSGCTKLEKINFGKINTSSVKAMPYLFHSCNSLTSIDLLNFNTSSVNDMQYMFSCCSSLLSLNLSNFDTTKVLDFHDFMSSCTNLMFVDFSNFDTSNAKNLRGIFYRCYNIRYLNLQNFITPKSETFAYIFSDCYKLIYVNIKQLILTDVVTDKRNMFRNKPTFLKVCINDERTKNKISDQINSDCSNICFNEDINIKVDLELNKCVENCTNKYQYINICSNQCFPGTYPKENEYLCLDKKPEGYYLDRINNFYKKCYDTCKNCDEGGDEINNNCTECKINYKDSNGNLYNILYELKINNYKNCYIKCPYYSYFDNITNIYYCTTNDSCPEEYNKLIYDKKECINICPNGTYYKEGEYLCQSQKPEGYYLDRINNFYKKCYDTCKNCDEGGDEKNNNCTECKSYYNISNDTLINFLYELNINNYKNCYIKCPYYSYFDHISNIYYCTKNEACP